MTISLLTEKYKPATIDEIIGNEETISSLKTILISSSIPHLLFVGPSGTGKTTAAKIIADIMTTDKKNILELNASDERGIETVRTTIKNFSKRLNVGLKIIILDECDFMTSVAQQAMRRTMELCAADCRFILVCNNVQKITEAIQSRCAVFLFNKIGTDAMKRRLKEIIQNESLDMTNDAVDTILFLSDNDMRQAINIIQATLYYSKTINETDILKITGQPSPKLIENIIIMLLKDNLDDAYSSFDCLWNEGYDSQDLLASFFKVAKNMNNYNVLISISKYNLWLFERIGSKLLFYSLLRDISLSCQNT